MLLGKKATAPEKDIRNDENLISGCESQAWLSFNINANQQLHFYADSDAKIIRGLLALVTDLSNGKNAQEIIDTDYDVIFAELGLQQHLSPSRGNGLLAITSRIKELAIQQLS